MMLVIPILTIFFVLR